MIFHTFVLILIAIGSSRIDTPITITNINMENLDACIKAKNQWEEKSEPYIRHKAECLDTYTGEFK